jgi:FlaA1/EpsC-like NDP-sugar epimerase
MFKDKTLIITGGTGSFWNAVLNYLLNQGFKEIRIFSPDEKDVEGLKELLLSLDIVRNELKNQPCQ